MMGFSHSGCISQGRGHSDTFLELGLGIKKSENFFWEFFGGVFGNYSITSIPFALSNSIARVISLGEIELSMTRYLDRILASGFFLMMSFTFWMSAFFPKFMASSSSEINSLVKLPRTV